MNTKKEWNEFEEHAKTCKWNKSPYFKVTFYPKDGFEITTYHIKKMVSLPTKKVDKLSKVRRFELWFTECEYCNRFLIKEGIHEEQPIIIEGRLLEINIIE